MVNNYVIPYVNQNSGLIKHLTLLIGLLIVRRSKLSLEVSILLSLKCHINYGIQISKIRGITENRISVPVAKVTVNSWLEQGDDTSTTLCAPSYGSFHPNDISITQAFSEQSRTLGWSSFLRGCISKLWGSAFLKLQRFNASCPSTSIHWMHRVILALLDYSSAIWSFRNGVLHGHTMGETVDCDMATIDADIRMHMGRINKTISSFLATSAPFLHPDHLSNV
jgi:hypothetical protein